MTEKSSVFEETYHNYLAQIANLDFKKIADQLGAEMVADEMIIPSDQPTSKLLFQSEVSSTLNW
jgi:hypothetical protein